MGQNHGSIPWVDTTYNTMSKFHMWMNTMGGYIPWVDEYHGYMSLTIPWENKYNGYMNTMV